MPRYFFHRADGGFMPDEEGSELGHIQDARIEAVAYAAETLTNRPDIVWSGHELQIQVTDESGTLLFTVKISSEDHPSS